MAYALLTLEEAKFDLQIEHDRDDARLAELIDDASKKVLARIGASLALVGYTDTEGNLLVDALGEPLFAHYPRAVYETEKQLDTNGDLVLDTNGDPVAALDTNGEPIYLLDTNLAKIPAVNRHGALRRATSLVVANFYQRSFDDPFSPAVDSLLSEVRDPHFA